MINDIRRSTGTTTGTAPSACRTAERSCTCLARPPRRRPARSCDGRPRRQHPAVEAHAGGADPRLSPDGKRIAFDSDEGQQAIVWIYDLSGMSAVRELHGRRPRPYPCLGRQRARRLSVGPRGRRGTVVAARETGPHRLAVDATRWGTSHLPESMSPDGRHATCRHHREWLDLTLAAW